MRASYPARELNEGELAPTWHEQLSRWLDEAVAAGLPEPNAMVLATADGEGRPTSRAVLAKGLDERGLVFFTNYTSRKMHDLRASCWASVTFPWFAMSRQVQLYGPTEMISDEETRAYWETRPRGSQLGAWASPQSSVVRSRRALDVALDQVAQRFATAERVPVPPHWGGVRIRPEAVEFWQGRPNRMHDRLCYRLEGDGEWTVERLAP
ncbi:MAG: pyridoxamine 5'-phosphate oxidase [Pseudonocardiaceae bacterium]